MPVGHDHETSSAPGDLEIVRRFVNTFDAETRTRRTWAARPSSRPGSVRSASPTGADATAADVARFDEVREALRSLLLANNGATL